MNDQLAQVAHARDRLANARALIFDVDGTLAETEEAHRQAFNETFKQAGLDWHWDRAAYKQLLRVAGGKERMRAFDQMRDDRPALSDADIAALHLAKTARYVAIVAQGGCPLRPGVKEALDTAEKRNQTLAIATTTSHANIDALLSVALGPGWADRFAAVVAGDDVPRKKPAPDVYVEMLARLAVPAADCIAIEDSRNGLVAASLAAIPTIITRSVYFDDEAFPEALAVVDDLAALIEGGERSTEDFDRNGRTGR